MTVCGYCPRSLLGYWEKRFAKKPVIWDAMLPVHYLNCPDLGVVKGFVRQPVYTILIDLTQQESEIFAACKSNTRNEISRANREGAELRIGRDFHRFLRLYEESAKYRQLPPTDLRYLRSYSDSLHMTEVWQGNTVLAAHIHVADKATRRVRLIRSASVFRDLDKVAQASAGRANRFLHYKDFLYFKSIGFERYDMGGYDPPGTTENEEFVRVSKFKISFGGEVVQEANYLAAVLHLYRRRPRFLRQPVGEREGPPI
jgi:hypothetical protein